MKAISSQFFFIFGTHFLTFSEGFIQTPHISQWNVSWGWGFVSLWKHRPTRWFRKFLTFSHMISVFIQPNWLYLGLKTRLVWKKDWIHVRKCRNFANSSCRPRFYFVVKTSADNMIWQIFDIFSHEFNRYSSQLTLFRPKNSIGLRKDWIHVRKCQNLRNHLVGRRFHNESKP